MKEKQQVALKKSRRKFLKTATKLAIYTPPAMLAVSKPSFATFARSGGAVGDWRGDNKVSKKKTSKKKVAKKKVTKKVSKKKIASKRNPAPV